MNFRDFFQSVYDYYPFAWQNELAEEVCQTGRWPDCIQLPTASGKTALIDVAVFSLAYLHRQNRETFRRIFFVVDRRLIVDEAHRRAKDLAQRLANSEHKSIREVATILREMARHPKLEQPSPLAVAALRGGTFRDFSWTQNPLQPLVVCSTVDQIGSRLLFRGYGSSSRQHSLHAGLVGNDSLVILDEAHISQPFEQTLRQVEAYRAQEPGPGRPRPFKLVVMSATPAPGQRRTFQPDLSKEGPILRARLQASKPAQLLEPGKLIEQLRDKALQLFDNGTRDVVVFVNRVTTARQLAKTLKPQPILLTGRMRELDRLQVLSKLKSLRTGSERSDDRRIVVATQCLEVGADLSFEGLVSECADLSALRQRFGRLNRDGKAQQSDAWIVIDKSDAKPRKPDPVYGDALPRTWEWLSQVSREGVVDFGIEAFQELLKQAPSNLDKENPDAPPLLPAYLNHLVQTEPAPEPEIDISSFLRGDNNTSADVRVLLRSDLRAERPRSGDQGKVDFPSPCTAETFPIPLAVFRRWLNGQDAGEVDSDLEGLAFSPTEPGRPQKERWGWRWQSDSRDEPWAFVDGSSRFLPGDVIALPDRIPGILSLLELPGVESQADQESLPPLDQGDPIQLLARRKLRLRLYPRLLESLTPQDEDSEKALTSLKKLLLSLEIEDESQMEELKELLERVQKIFPTPLQWILQQILGSHRIYHQIREQNTAVERAIILSCKASIRVEDYLRVLGIGEEVNAMDEIREEPLAEERSLGSYKVTLTEHCTGVGHLAHYFAEKLGLPAEYADLLGLSGRSHDIGKSDPAFQVWLRGGNRFLMNSQSELLAKSDFNSTSSQRRRARVKSGYPAGGRHELVSARALADAPELLAKCADPELLLHLVASHHGYCRPFAPVISDPRPGVRSLKFMVDSIEVGAPVVSGWEHLVWGQSERFWRQIDKFGWWSLSFLETLLMCADHTQSASEREEI